MFCNKQYTGNTLRENNFLEDNIQGCLTFLDYYLKLKAMPLSI